MAQLPFLPLFISTKHSRESRTQAVDVKGELEAEAFGIVYRTEDVGVYARPPSTSTPELAAKLATALGQNRDKRQIEKLRIRNVTGEMILLASAGASKKSDLLQLQGYDPIAQWNSGFLYMAFDPLITNVVNAVNELNMMNIAHVWLMPDGSIKPVTKESMAQWSRKMVASGDLGMNVPVHLSLIHI